MKTTTKNTGIKVNTGVKAGGWAPDRNHNVTGLRVRAGIKAGSMIKHYNHNRLLFCVA